MAWDGATGVCDGLISAIRQSRSFRVLLATGDAHVSLADLPFLDLVTEAHPGTLFRGTKNSDKLIVGYCSTAQALIVGSAFNIPPQGRR